MNPSLSNATPPHPDTWRALIEQGDGYLTPSQRQAFEAAINMVLERVHYSLDKPVSLAEKAERFDLQRYLETIEERFINDASTESELLQDAALTAARVITQIGQLITTNK